MNIVLLRQIMRQIEDYPRSWNQGAWHCGKSHCIGGWAQILSGSLSPLEIQDQSYAAVEDAAVDALGLSDRAAQLHWLFRSDRTLNQLRMFTHVAGWGLDEFGIPTDFGGQSIPSKEWKKFKGTYPKLTPRPPRWTISRRT